MSEPTMSQADADFLVATFFARLAEFAGPFATQLAANHVATNAPVDIDALDDAQIKRELRAAGYLNSQLKDQPHEVLVEALQKVYNGAVSQEGEDEAEDEAETEGVEDEAEAEEAAEEDEPEETEEEPGTRADYAGKNPATGKAFTLPELRAIARERGYKPSDVKGRDKGGLLDLMFPEEADAEPEDTEDEPEVDLPEDIYTRAQLEAKSPKQLREIAAEYEDVTFAPGAEQPDMVDTLIEAENAYMANILGLDIELV